MLVSTFDAELGMVRTVATGFQTEPEIQSHLDILAQLVRTARACTGHVLHLVDATQAALQPLSGSPSVTKATETGRIRVDRVAVVTASALSKMQVKRLYVAQPLHVFGNVDEAIAWLRSSPSAAQAS